MCRRESLIADFSDGAVTTPVAGHGLVARRV
jgi:hypothetical protein